MEIELWDYRGRQGQMDRLNRGLEASVLPLREDLGFRLTGAWVDADHHR